MPPERRAASVDPRADGSAAPAAAGASDLPPELKQALKLLVDDVPRLLGLPGPDGQPRPALSRAEGMEVALRVSQGLALMDNKHLPAVYKRPAVVWSYTLLLCCTST
jgi:hypothetical protein